MVGWLKKNKAEKTAVSRKEIEAAPEKPAALRDRFKVAVHGNHFRSRAFTNSADAVDGREWREARYIPITGWTIKRMRQYEDAVAGEPVVDQQTIAFEGNTDFYAVVESMAWYEKSQGEMGYVPCDEPGKDFPQEKYFRTFAENEGIAFDLKGDPHPTTPEGLIPDDGAYSLRTLQKALAANGKRGLEVEGLPADILPRRLNIDAGDIVALGQIAALQSMVSLFERMRDFVKSAEGNGWASSVVSAYWTIKGKDMYGQTYRQAADLWAEETYSTFFKYNQSLSNSAVVTNSLKEEFLRAYRLMILNTRLSSTRDLFQKCSAAPEDWSSRQALDGEVWKVKTVLAELGYDAAKSQLPGDASFFASLQKGWAIEQMDKIIAWTKGVRDEIEGGPDSQAAPARPALPAPRP